MLWWFFCGVKMKNDFDMVVHHFNEPIVIYPISDVHFGALEHMHKEWLEFCKVVSMVSWLNYGGYAMRKMLLPAHVADPQKLKLSASKKNKKIEVIW